MSFIPEDEIKGKGIQSMAPMIDFLFIMLMFFASLAISRITTKETDIDLVAISNEAKAKNDQENPEHKIINLSISEQGHYKWMTEVHDYEMDSPEAICKELAQQYERGLLPEDKSKVLVLLKIDKKAQWEPILKLMFAVRDAGYEIHPLYRVDES